MSFVRQHPLLWVFLRIMLLRQQPDILPASLFLFGLLLVANLLIGIASFLSDFDLLPSVLRTIADLGDEQEIAPPHVAEALSLRQLDKRKMQALRPTATR